MTKKRLAQRKLRIWNAEYLVHRHLWPNIEWAVQSAFQQIHTDTPVVVDVGCGQRPFADLFAGCRYLAINHELSGACPDVLGDAMTIPLHDACADIVFSTQVIEHVSDPKKMVRECLRILRPSGFLILTGPFYWPLHEEPLDFHRFTKYGFENLLREAGFFTWQIHPDGGYWAQVFLSISLAFQNRWAAAPRVLFNCAGVMLDKLFPSYICTSNYTILAQK